MSVTETRREKAEALAKVTDNELPEEKQVLLEWDALSQQQVQDLLDKNLTDIHAEMQEILGFRNRQTCMMEAALLDYYVCGFWWAKEANFTSMQTSFIMAVLHMLLKNIEDKGMALVENLVEFTKVLAAACHPPTSDSSPLLSSEEAKALISYIKSSLFQNYRLYQLLFTTSREELLMKMERTIEVFDYQIGFPPLEDIPVHLPTEETVLPAKADDDDDGQNVG